MRIGAAIVGLVMTFVIMAAVVTFTGPTAEVTIDDPLLGNEVASAAATPTVPVDEPDATEASAEADADKAAAIEVAATPTPDAAAIAAAEAAAPVEFSMAFSGDVLSHMPVISRALANGNAELEYDYRPMFADVRAELSAADLAICVLETPVSTSNGRLSGYPVFYAPAELPDALIDAGFDGCSTASNHSYDQGTEGLNSTLNQLDRVGLQQAGMARTADEKDSITIYEIGGATVAHLSYTYGLNGFILPEGEEYLVNVTEEVAVLEEARRAKEQGADLVFLSIQWGNEYQRAPSPVQLGQADVFTASGDIDLIVGNHVHVVQPIGVINDVPVIFGLGNFLSNQSGECCPAASQDGVIVVAHVSGTKGDGLRITNLEVLPTWVDRSDYTIIHLPDALDDETLDPGLREVYQLSFDRTMEAISLLGASVSGSANGDSDADGDGDGEITSAGEGAPATTETPADG